MKRTLTLVFLLGIYARPCSQAIGYFHQVTQLRGEVVGVKEGDWRHEIRWLRHKALRPGVSLTLYAYRWPTMRWTDLPVVKTVQADAHGRFDFGALAEGHYILVLSDPAGRMDSFEVQITHSGHPTNSILIDISPVYPGCSGGHEFLVH